MASRARVRRLFAAALLPILVVGTTMPVAAADRTAADLSAEQLTPVQRVEGAKSASSRLAKTDPELLARNDRTPVLVMIKLDYDALASYTGSVKGFAATSPRATGRSLTGGSKVEKAYLGYVQAQEAPAVKALKQIKGVTVRRAFRLVYGGLAARIPANAVEQILKIPGVTAVQYDEARQPTTDASPDFIGADAAYARLGTTRNAGQGKIFANLDTGVWPEHPSFADQGNLPAPPARPGGGTRTCNFGDNPVTPATDVFVCQDKLIGGEPFLETSNEFNPDETFPDSARDSDGHGTHTASTAAGNVLASAAHYGVNRGPLNGVAPGAHVMVYKVCGIAGCYVSDSADAVEEAILDGVNVINFSVGGGDDPFTDPVELAFLDAFAAGVFTAASAGNDGPGANTGGHLSPWVTTVGASTQTREFANRLTITSTAGTAVFEGASITAGAGPAPVVLSSAAPYSNNLCTAPAAPDSLAGLIVACQRGTNSRVSKGYNVLQGGAVGMILYNPSLADTVTDNHWLPTIHLADGTDFVAFMAAGTGEIGTFTAGAARDGQGDVIANFSSRGPGGLFIKPDVAAPGVQILAGHTPVPETIDGGPPGELFQAIAGTSMAAPHVAGAALLVSAVRGPAWSPAEIKSALMTTSTRDVVKEDTVTPADSFDMGAGRIDVAAALNAPLALDETAANFAALGNDELNAVHLNIASINANVVPGRLTTTRRVQNMTGARRTFNAFGVDGAGSRLGVSPSTFTLNSGRSQLLTITIYADADSDAQQFASVELRSRGMPDQHLPVAFIKSQGSVSLNQTCHADELYLEQTATCEIVATNNSFDEQVVDLDTYVNDRLWIRRSSGATRVSGSQVRKHDVVLAGGAAGIPSMIPFGPIGGPDGYLPLAGFGVTPDTIGDEEAINFNVPEYVYNGVTYDSLGVVSNGYIVAGGATSEDINCCTLPSGTSPAPPNDVLAPFWADLEGTDSPGIYAAVLSSPTQSWLVIEFQLEAYDTEDLKVFQVWIGINGEQDITYNYKPGNASLTGVFMGPGGGLLIGAENAIGQGQMIKDTAPTTDLEIISTDPVPGASTSYSVVVKGVKFGHGAVTTSMKATGVPGTTVVQDAIQVLAP